MMMEQCGIGMMLVGTLGAVLGLGLLASLIVLVWVVIVRLRVSRGYSTRFTAM
jgi:cell division protein FtsX